MTVTSTKEDLRLSLWVIAVECFWAVCCVKEEWTVMSKTFTVPIKGMMDHHTVMAWHADVKLVLPSNTVSCLGYTVSNERMSMEHWWMMVKGKLYLDKTLSHCNSVHHKSHIYWSVTNCLSHGTAGSSTRSWRQCWPWDTDGCERHPYTWQRWPWDTDGCGRHPYKWQCWPWDSDGCERHPYKWQSCRQVHISYNLDSNSDLQTGCPDERVSWLMPLL